MGIFESPVVLPRFAKTIDDVPVYNLHRGSWYRYPDEDETESMVRLLERQKGRCFVCHRKLRRTALEMSSGVLPTCYIHQGCRGRYFRLYKQAIDQLFPALGDAMRKVFGDEVSEITRRAADTVKEYSSYVEEIRKGS